MLSAYVYAACFIAIVAAIILWFRWKEMDLGQRIYGCAFSVLFLSGFIYVPFQIPTTGVVVHDFIWQPAEYTDEDAAKNLTPQVIEAIENDDQIPAAEDWARDSTVKQAPVDLSRHRIYLVCLLLIGAVGWFVFPPLLTRIIYGGRRHRS